MTPKSYKDILENAARRHIPNDADYRNGILARLDHRKSLQLLIRTRPVLAMFIALFALLLLSGVVYALGRSLGYIPGIGMIDQSTPLRILAEPVSVTREGITLTVEQAVLSTDKTVLIYKVEGIPVDAYANDVREGNAGYSSSSSTNLEGTPDVSHSTFENVALCASDDRLVLPDGTLIRATGGEGSAWQSGYERRFNYAAIPPDVNDAKLTISCIDGTSLGALPENWELALHFVPAPPEMTVLPVVEVVSSTASPSQSAITVEQVVETNDGYILTGKFRLIGYPSNIVPNGFETNWIKITDAAGRAVEACPANGIQSESPLNGEVSWAYELKGKQHIFPLTITFEAVPAYILNETAEFEFDTGENPQIGQSWNLEPDIELAGYDIHKISITRTSNGYDLHFKVDPDLELFTPEIKGVPTSRGGGGNDGFGRGEIYFHLEYQGEPPSGKLTIKLDEVRAAIHGPWHTQWSPEPLPASLYGISLHVDQFIPLEDGYYLIGHTEWTNDRITSVGPGGWALKAYDATGREVPIEPAIFGNDQVAQSLQPGQWAYRLYGKNFNGPLTLHVPLMSVEFKDPVRFTLDLSSIGFEFSDPYLGSSWKLDSPLDVPEISASVTSATYVQQGDLHGFEFTVQADPSLQGLGFNFESGLATTGMSAVAGGGGSNRDEAADMILSTVLTNAQMQFPLVLSATGGAINGVWETTWNPPIDPAVSTPILIEQPCLDLHRWKEVVKYPGPVPPELLEQISVQTTEISPDGQWIAYSEKVLGRMTPGIFVSKLDGSEKRLLVQLDYWASTVSHWSEDGKWLMFTVIDMDQYNTPSQRGAIHIETCEVLPLP